MGRRSLGGGSGMDSQKKEIEYLLLAAQEQVLGTNSIKHIVNLRDATV